MLTALVPFATVFFGILWLVLLVLNGRARKAEHQKRIKLIAEHLEFRRDHGL